MSGAYKLYYLRYETQFRNVDATWGCKVLRTIIIVPEYISYIPVIWGRNLDFLCGRTLVMLIVAYYFMTLTLISVLFKQCTEHISNTMYDIEIQNLIGVLECCMLFEGTVGLDL